MKKHRKQGKLKASDWAALELLKSAISSISQTAKRPNSLGSGSKTPVRKTGN